MTGIFFEQNAIVATDGYTLFYNRNERQQGVSFILPATVAPLLKGLKKATATITDNLAVIETENDTITTPIITEKFPNYPAILPKQTETTAQFDRDNLAQAVAMIEIAVNKTTPIVKMEYNDTQTVHLSCENETSKTHCIVPFGGTANLTIGFNIAYLKKILSCFKTDKIQGNFNTNTQATIWKCEEKQTDLILMPVRIEPTEPAKPEPAKPEPATEPATA
jgi:DNA polymerase-3 subunit beta